MQAMKKTAEDVRYELSRWRKTVERTISKGGGLKKMTHLKSLKKNLALAGEHLAESSPDLVAKDSFYAEVMQAIIPLQQIDGEKLYQLRTLITLLVSQLPIHKPHIPFDHAKHQSLWIIDAEYNDFVNPDNGQKQTSIIELAILVVSPETFLIEEEHSNLILPHPGMTMNPHQSKLTGITLAALKNCPTFKDIADKMISLRETYGHPLVIHWGGHDPDMIKTEFLRTSPLNVNDFHKLFSFFDFQAICSKSAGEKQLSLARAFELYLAHNEGKEDWHRAIIDCQAIFQIMHNTVNPFPKSNASSGERSSPKAGGRKKNILISNDRQMDLL